MKRSNDWSFCAAGLVRFRKYSVAETLCSTERDISFRPLYYCCSPCNLSLRKVLVVFLPKTEAETRAMTVSAVENYEDEVDEFG